MQKPRRQKPGRRKKCQEENRLCWIQFFSLAAEQLTLVKKSESLVKIVVCSELWWWNWMIWICWWWLREVQMSASWTYGILTERLVGRLQVRKEIIKIKLPTLQHGALDVKGDVEAVTGSETSRRMQSSQLISQKILTELGMLRIQQDSNLAEPNNLEISREGHACAVKQ